MARTYIEINIHMIWTTLRRAPLIMPEWEGRLHAGISAKCREMRCEPVEIGGIEDHVHVLLKLHATVSIAQIAKGLKGASSHLVSHKLAPNGHFDWQRGYGAFSVSPNHVARVRKYIRNQKFHHQHNNLWPKFEETADPADQQTATPE